MIKNNRKFGRYFSPFYITDTSGLRGYLSLVDVDVGFPESF